MTKDEALALSPLTKERRDDLDRGLSHIRTSLMYWGRDGLPLTFGEWAALHDVYEYKMVCETFVDGFRVSTVWLGLDHGFGSEVPIIFETMVFDWSVVETHPPGLLFSREWHTHPTIDALGEGYDTQLRYATEDEAMRGHNLVVCVLAKKLLEWSTEIDQELSDAH